MAIKFTSINTTKGRLKEKYVDQKEMDQIKREADRLKHNHINWAGKAKKERCDIS